MVRQHSAKSAGCNKLSMKPRILNCKDLLYYIFNLDMQSSPTLCIILTSINTSDLVFGLNGCPSKCMLWLYVFSLSGPLIFRAISTEERRLCVGPTMPTRAVRGEHRRYQF